MSDIAAVLSGARRWAVVQGNALDVLGTMPDGSVRCCVTSPPYWGLRRYECEPVIFDAGPAWPGGPPCEHLFGDELPPHHPGQVEQTKWKKASAAGSGQTAASGAFCRICGAWRGQLGLEPTPALYVKHIVSIFREVRRVLADDGTLWLNLGDCYNAGTSSERRPSRTTEHGYWTNSAITMRVTEAGSKPKDLIGMPWMVAFALRDDGWFLRAEVIWCLSGGAWVYTRTQKGDMPVMVKDLVRLDPRTVRLWNGTKWTSAVSWTMSRGGSRSVELHLRSGERIGCTSSHLWPTSRGLIPASMLRVGDVLCSTEIPEPKTARCPDFLTDDALWLAGLFLAEGNRSGDGLALSLGAREVPFASRAYRVARHFGGTCSWSTKGGSLRVLMFGGVLRSVILSIVAGRDAHDKHLRPEVWRLPNRCLRLIVDGYLDGDGSRDEINSRHRLGFCRNYNLERDLRTAAARLGATITLKPCVVMYQGGKKPAFRGEWRWSRSGHHNEKDRGEVIAIRRSRARVFWNIEVEDEPHTYALASGVLTHNSKPACMPESVRDRPTRAHEQLFLLSKSADYFYDTAAASDPALREARGNTKRKFGADVGSPSDNGKHQGRSVPWRGDRRNWRTVWSINPEPTSEEHFAAYPTELPRRCVTAGTEHDDVVLDPFNGIGRTGSAALGLGRRYIGIDLSEKYAEASRRILGREEGTVRPADAKHGEQIGLLAAIAAEGGSR